MNEILENIINRCGWVFILMTIIYSYMIIKIYIEHLKGKKVDGDELINFCFMILLITLVLSIISYIYFSRR